MSQFVDAVIFTFNDINIAESYIKWKNNKSMVLIDENELHLQIVTNYDMIPARRIIGLKKEAIGFQAGFLSKNGS